MKGFSLGLASSAVTLVLFFSYWPLSRLDLALYDRSLASFYARGPAPEEIVLAAIDEASLRSLGSWPWPRALHARAIEHLSRDGAKAVYLDVGIFDPDVSDPTNDRRLIEATSRAGNVVYPMVFHEADEAGGGGVVPLEPLPELAAAASGVAHAHLEFGAGDIVRSVHLAYRTGDRVYWGPSVEMMRRYLGLSRDDVRAPDPGVLTLGEIEVPVSRDVASEDRQPYGGCTSPSSEAPARSRESPRSISSKVVSLRARSAASSSSTA